MGFIKEQSKTDSLVGCSKQNMMVKSAITLLSLMLVPLTPVLGDSKIVLHSSGAQCNAINWSIIDKDKSHLLGENLSEELLMNNEFNVGFLAQVMPVSGYPIEFQSGNTLDTTENFKPTRWALIDGQLVLKTEDDKHLYTFSYSETCLALVHEHNFYGSPQVIEIAMVKRTP